MPDDLKSEPGADTVRAIAAGLGEQGYPFDVQFADAPPEPLRLALEDWWVSADGDDDDKWRKPCRT